MSKMINLKDNFVEIYFAKDEGRRTRAWRLFGLEERILYNTLRLTIFSKFNVPSTASQEIKISNISLP